MDSPSYGKCFLSLAAGLAPLGLIFGIAAVFGSNTVSWNGQYLYGVPGMLVSIALIIVFAAIFAGLQKLGYWLLGLIRRRPAEV